LVLERKESRIDSVLLTNAEFERFNYPWKALEHLVEEGVDGFPAVATKFSSRER